MSVCLLATGVMLAAQAPPAPSEISAPKDVPFRGMIRLSIDATDTVRHIFRVHETIPAAPGPMLLLYPRWLPGTHAPTGRIDQLAGLTIRAGTTRLNWSRDPLDVYAFRVTVPAGARALDIDFQIVTSTDADQGRVVITPDMLNLEWNAVALYPAGYYARRIIFEPSIRLPEGWQLGTALDTASANAGTTTFKAVGFDTLVDSPIFAGRNFKRVELDPNGPARVSLNIVADRQSCSRSSPKRLMPIANW